MIDSAMLFRNLSGSAALQLESYIDIDHFHESERYAKAESLPLSCHNFSAIRAGLLMPACTLSLVRTFPRIVNGYDLSGRLLIVIPMDEVTSAKINGDVVYQSLILLKGGTCTVVEPEGRLVAILSIRAEAVDTGWGAFDGSYQLIELAPAALAGIKAFIRFALEFAASHSEAMTAADVVEKFQFTLLTRLEHLLNTGPARREEVQAARGQYLRIVNQVDALIGTNPLNTGNERLADEIGVSVRTLQTASQSICGISIYQYSRLRRLWSMRRQLRTGAPGLTIKASALAHGFWHMSELSRTYHDAFGELPSQTLERARSKLQL